MAGSRNELQRGSFLHRGCSSLELEELPWLSQVWCRRLEMLFMMDVSLTIIVPSAPSWMESSRESESHSLVVQIPPVLLTRLSQHMICHPFLTTWQQPSVYWRSLNKSLKLMGSVILLDFPLLRNLWKLPFIFSFLQDQSPFLLYLNLLFKSSRN